MSPKRWNYHVSISDQALGELIVTHVRVIERMQWKAMGPEEFGSHLAGFLLGLASKTIRVSKPQFLQVTAKKKLALSSAESSLFVEKVSHCISYILRKLSNAGSGKYLPEIVRKVERTWKKYHSREKAGSKVPPSDASSKRLSKEISQDDGQDDGQDCQLGIAMKKNLQGVPNSVSCP